MAATTLTFTGNGVQDTGALAAATSTCLITGLIEGANIVLELSNDGTNWGRILASLGSGTKREGFEPAAYSLSIPAGWRLRATVTQKTGTGTLLISVE